MDLASARCVPCEEGAPTLTGDEVKNYIKNTPDWQLYDNDTKIKRVFEFRNFTQAIEFIVKVGETAEKLGHHPNLYLFDFKKVQVELWTHKINGLHKNDFILAYHIDQVYKEFSVES